MSDLYLAGFLAGAQAGFEAAAHSLGGPEVVLAGARRAQDGLGASEPVLVPPRQAEAAYGHPRRAESEVQAEALRRVAAMPAARRVNTSNGNTDGREWLNFCADQIDRGARL